MKTITRNDLIALIKSTEKQGATPVGLDYEAPVELKKTGNPYKDRTVTKFSSVSGMINTDYEMAVNRQLAREGKDTNFTTEDRSWGEHVSPALVVHEKTGDYSIQMQMINKPSEVVFKMDGEIVDKSLIENWLPKSHAPANQGTEKPVVIRTYKIDRIKAIRINGEAYIVS